MQIYTVGRKSANVPVDIAIPRDHDTVGRVHLEITCLDDGRYYIVDQKTVNKTWLHDGQRWNEITESYVDLNTPIRLGAYQTSVSDLLGMLANAPQAVTPQYYGSQQMAADGSMRDVTPGHELNIIDSPAVAQDVVPYDDFQPQTYQPQQSASAPLYPLAEPVSQPPALQPQGNQYPLNPMEHQENRPLGDIRDNMSVILLSMFTFGIYSIFWYYGSFDSLRKYRGQGWSGTQLLVFTLVPLVSVVGVAIPWLLPSYVGNLYAEDGRQKPVTGYTGFLVLIPLVGSIIWLIQVNSALNEFWRSKGAVG